MDSTGHAVERQHPSDKSDRMDAAVFKRPVPAKSKSASQTESVPGGRSIVAAKSAKQVASPSELKGLPGHYWFGAY
jgi:hypothetical protein